MYWKCPMQLKPLPWGWQRLQTRQQTGSRGQQGHTERLLPLLQAPEPQQELFRELPGSLHRGQKCRCENRVGHHTSAVFFEQTQSFPEIYINGFDCCSKSLFPPKQLLLLQWLKPKMQAIYKTDLKLKMLVMHSSFRLCGLYDNFLSFRFHHLSLTTKYDHCMWANAAELLLTKPDIPATYLSIFAVVHTALTRGCSNPPIPTLKHMTATQHLPTAEF